MSERNYERINDLPEGITPVTGAELVELEQDGVSRKFSMTALAGITNPHEETHQRGGADAVGTLEKTAYAIPYLESDGTIDSRVSDASTTKKGKVQLATSGEVSAKKAVTGTDARLSDARTPTAHAEQHIAGTDVIADATVSNSGLMSATDKVKADATIPAYIPTADQKAALAGTSGTPSASNPFVTTTDLRLVGGGGDGTTDALVRAWASFFSVFSEEQPTGQTPRTWRGLASHDGDLYAAVAGEDIYKMDGAGVFQPTGQTPRNWRVLASHGGDLYAAVDNGDIYKMDGAGVFQPTGQTPRTWRGLASHDGDLYAAVYGGDIYKMDSSGVFQPTGQTPKDWFVLASHGGDLYAAVAGEDIYKMDGAGVFQPTGQTPKDWFGLASHGGDLYATVFNGDIYKMDGAGVFQPTGQTTRNWFVLASHDGDLYAAVYNGDIYLLTTSNPSVNISKTDYVVPISSSFPINGRKVYRRTSAYDGNPLTITPPSGATFEGLASINLYGQYSYVELERISATVFAIKELKDTAIINIRDYGAIGDGVTDNTEVLTTALATPGISEIYIPDGVYIVSATLTVPSTIKKIYGVGTIKSNISTAATAMIILDGATTVSDIKLEGNNSIDTAIFTTNPVKIENVEIYCFFEGINYQLSDSYSGAIFSKCYIHDNVTGLRIVNRAEYCKILECSIIQNTVGVYLTAGNAIIDGNTVNGNGSGIVLAEGSNDSHTIIVGNNVNHNTAYGIRLINLTEFMCNVSENHLFNHGCTGASLSVEHILAIRSCIINNNFISGGATLDADNLNAPIHFISNVMADLPVTQSNDTVVYYGRESIDKHTRIKYLTGTTAAAQGGSVGIAHGVDASKITAVHILVYSSHNGSWIPPEFTFDDDHVYSYLVKDVNVVVYNIDAKSYQILSAPIKISIEYEV